VQNTGWIKGSSNSSVGFLSTLPLRCCPATKLQSTESNRLNGGTEGVILLSIFNPHSTQLNWLQKGSHFHPIVLQDVSVVYSFGLLLTAGLLFLLFTPTAPWRGGGGWSTCGEMNSKWVHYKAAPNGNGPKTGVEHKKFGGLETFFALHFCGRRIIPKWLSLDWGWSAYSIRIRCVYLYSPYFCVNPFDLEPIPITTPPTDFFRIGGRMRGPCACRQGEDDAEADEGAGRWD